MKKTLLIILPLLLIVGCSKVEGKQDLIPVVETYNNGDIKSITYHKKTRNKIEKVKYEEYHWNGGQKKKEETYKDGIKDGLYTEWFDNGQKYWEVTYKDGKLDGLLTSWYANGQKKWEATFRGGEFISSKCWDWNGNEMDCPSEDVIQDD